MASPIAIPGVGSNLDVSSLVTKLMTVESQPLTDLNTKEAAVNVTISAFGSFRGALSSFQGSLQGLEDPSAYTAMRSTLGDSTVASASSQPGADGGSHTLEVTNLAQAQRLKSTTYQNISDTVGTGTLTIDYGTYDSTGNTFSQNGKATSLTVNIDSAHNTLAGVRDSINAANGGVTASILNDGTGNRLVISAKNSGTVNSLRIGVSDGDGNATDTTGLSALAYDPTATAGAGQNMTQVVAAKDAQFMLDGISITKSSNVVTDVLTGTTLTLSKTNAGAPTTLNIAQDTSGVKTAVDAFIKGYNDLNTEIGQLTNYDASTKVAGPLQSDSSVRSLVEQIRDGLSAIVGGIPGGFHALAQIGITHDDKGMLSVDSTKLNSALASNPQAVQALFATGGFSNDSLVSYVGSTASTPAGSYGLNIAQLATQGTATSSSVAALTIDSTNDSLTATVDGVATTITLDHATYGSADALAAAVQSQLNGSSAFTSAGVGVDVTQTGGVLSLKSHSYGSTSSVALNGGSAQAALFGTATSTAGLDVAGTIGGNFAQGKGQTLTASNGLSVKISGGSTGQRGTVSFSRGVAVQLDSLITKAIGTTGIIATRNTSLQGQIKSMDADRVKIQAQLDAKQAQYTQQFTTLDGLITTMNSTMSYLTQQLSALETSTK
jgi:flagellar hook-associated protein 2